jgi:hypothetical protein
VAAIVIGLIGGFVLFLAALQFGWLDPVFKIIDALQGYSG